MAVKVSEHENGVAVYQVTEDLLEKSNIYCETPWCSADGKNFVYQQTPAGNGPNRSEYILCEFGTWKARSAGRGLGAPSINHDGIFHYRRVTKTESQELVRLDLATGNSEVIHEFPKDLPLRTRGWGAVSRDERYFAYGVSLNYDPPLFGIDLIDLTDGSHNRIVEDRFICNPHTQFEPGGSRQLLVQHNRGCRFQADGTMIDLVGPEGGTLFLVDIPDGKITRLQLGPPFTPGITGHEAWIAGTGEILLSVRAVGSYAPEKGNLVRIGPGAPPKIVSGGYRFNHVGVSACGRFFSCDDWQGDSKLVIGSIETGKNAVVCEAHTSRGRSQNTHGHPYLSPDLKWLVFNSDRTGRPQVYAASVPPEMIEDLEKA